MELLSFHDQFVAELSPHQEQDDLLCLDIIQNKEVADARLELGKRVRTQPLDGLCRCCWLMEEAGLDRRLE